jgi:hypothetical protein
MFCKRKVLIFVATISLFGISMLNAKDVVAKTKPTYASDILMNSYRFIDSLKHFEIEADSISDDLYRNRVVTQWSHKIDIEVQRPSKLYVDISGDVKNQEIYLNSSTFTIYSKKYNMYGELKAKDSIDDTLDMLFDNYDIKAPLANLLYSDIEKRLKPKSKGYYFGLVKLDGVLCDYIGFSNRYREFQVWIEHTKTPLIRKFIIIDKTTKYRLRSQSVIKWNLNPFSFFDSFKFTPPSKSIKIDILPLKD